MWVEGTFKKQDKNKEEATTDRVSATKEPITIDKKGTQRDEPGNLEGNQSSSIANTKSESQIA